MTAGVPILGRAPEDLNRLTIHVRSRLVIGHLGEVHHKHSESKERHVIEGSSTLLLEEDIHEEAEVGWSSTPL